MKNNYYLVNDGEAMEFLSRDEMEAWAKTIAKTGERAKFIIVYAPDKATAVATARVREAIARTKEEIRQATIRGVKATTLKLRQKAEAEKITAVALLAKLRDSQAVWRW